TAAGGGVCIGRPVEGMNVRIIRISDEPISTWSDSLLLPTGQVGEIVVAGPVVTKGYFFKPQLTSLSKIRDPQTGRTFHRMGDLGYLQSQVRAWSCGRT